MIKREITQELQESYKEYPVVTVLGPRQSGKTTLVRHIFPKLSYSSLEDPDVRMIAESDPRGYLENLGNKCIIDEVQRVPDLLSYIQGIVDNDSKRKYILTGSHQPRLQEVISQSLAGRTAIITLYPFSLEELAVYKKKWDPFELCVAGGFPRLHDENLKTSRFYNGYIQTYLERDVRRIINVKDLRSFQQFMVLLAGRVGQVVNYTTLSNDIGVSSTTIKSWLSVLKSSFLVFELSPFFRNVSKRVIKSPKLYFTDTGLVCRLLNIDTAAQAERDPLRGFVYENLIISEILKICCNNGIDPRLYFYRDTHGNEVDLLIDTGRQVVPIEIKSASTFSPDFVKLLNSLKEFTKGAVASEGFVLYNGQQSLQYKGNYIFNPLKHDSLTKIVKSGKYR